MIAKKEESPWDELTPKEQEVVNGMLNDFFAKLENKSPRNRRRSDSKKSSKRGSRGHGICRQ